MLGAMELKDLIGTQISVMSEWFARLSPEAEEAWERDGKLKLETVTLHGVEPGGIWVESENIN